MTESKKDQMEARAFAEKATLPWTAEAQKLTAWNQLAAQAFTEQGFLAGAAHKAKELEPEIARLQEWNDRITGRQEYESWCEERAKRAALIEELLPLTNIPVGDPSKIDLVRDLHSRCIAVAKIVSKLKEK